MANQISPTVFRRRVSDYAYEAWLMSQVESQAVAVAADRPGFTAAYWDAFAEAHPRMAEVVGVAVWFVAATFAGVAVVGSMVAVRL